MKRRAPTKRPVTITICEDRHGLSITTSGVTKLARVGEILALAALATFLRLGKRR